MTRIVIGTLLCLWGLATVLAVILTPEEFEGHPQLGLLATSLVFIIPGIILIYFGNKVRKNKKNKNDRESIQKSITKESTEVIVDKKSSLIELPIIQEQKKITNIYSRKENLRLINKIITCADSIPSKTGEQEKRLAMLTLYGRNFITEIETAIRSSIQFGNPEYIYINAGLLCKTIGEMKGANSFTILSNLLTYETYINEYKYIRIGAIRGLMQLHNRKAIPLLKELKDPNIPESIINEAIQFIESKEPHATHFTDQEMLKYLRELCELYVWRTESPERFSTDPQARKRYEKSESKKKRLESIATEIGEELNRRGGIEEMRRIWSKLNNIRGSRTLDMHWNGIGDWRG